MLKVRQRDGQPIPVGAEVLDSQSKWLSLVGQGGRIFLRVPDRQGLVRVTWGKEGSESCRQLQPT
ncbi:FimD/PapC C-terminal domain-containing protein [Pseudomonas aeruginosa]|nr:FimD/PapC C-terminal domain-containing protein [Pseudomonas aeruginosa]